MDRSNPFHAHAALVLRVLPSVAKCRDFALKGGTAINFFLRDMPRLSVDVDLTYVPRVGREAATGDMKRGLSEVARHVQSVDPGIRMRAVPGKQFRIAAVSRGYCVKIEVNDVMRGAVWPVETREVSEKASENLGYSRNPVLSFDDIYAGKICAALDRQHPRDLFDIALLLDREGIGRNLLKTFLVYLICHRRPIAELLDPARIRYADMKAIYDREFKDMVLVDAPFDKLVDARERLVDRLHSALADEDRRFLLSVKARTPDWSGIDLDGVANLPAVRWKMANLKRMDKDKHRNALENLRRVLDEGPRRTVV